jgi:F0F1-type ATP synthase assembly protein I
MSKRRLFLFLASAAGYIGLGMLLGYVLSDQTTNTPLWIGIVLTLLGAILLGMFISARAVTGAITYDSPREASSTNSTDPTGSDQTTRPQEEK